MQGRRFSLVYSLELLCRYALAAVFIFSGFVKAVDPMGGAIKFGEYAAAINLGLPYEIFLLCSILLSAVEFGLGVALLLRVGRRFSTGLVMAMMIFFTVLTLFIAIWNPVPDCGCFGEAVKLSNWQTFYKNLVLLPMSVFLFASRSRTSMREIRVDIALLIICFCLSLPISLYGVRHLPILDFMPFKVGVNISDAMQTEGEVETTLIYRDMQNDKIVEFALDDTTWYDDSRYEFVDTRIVQSSQADIIDFSLYRLDEDISPQVLSADRVVLVFSELHDKADAKSRANVERLLEKTYELDYQTYYITCEDTDSEYIELGNHVLRTAFIDPITRKMLLRANFGVVILEQGTIVAKWNARDIPPLLSGRLIDM